MELKRFGSRDEIVLPPTFGGSIAATGEKPMQHGEINGPLNVKVVAASFEQRSNYLLNPAFFPEPPKDQVRPDALHRDSLSLAAACASIRANFSQWRIPERISASSRPLALS